MIRKYNLRDLDLVEKINKDFFGRIVTRDDIDDELERLRKDLPDTEGFNRKYPVIFNVQRDNNLSMRSDLVKKLSRTPVFRRKPEKGENPYDTTMRFRRHFSTGEPIVRIPPGQRVPLYDDPENTGIIHEENQIGYLVLGDYFIVCSFAEADYVLEDSFCKKKTIKERKKRLSDIYSGIKDHELISIYLINNFVDEQYLRYSDFSKKSA